MYICVHVHMYMYINNVQCSCTCKHVHVSISILPKADGVSCIPNMRRHNSALCVQEDCSSVDVHVHVYVHICTHTPN